MPFLDFTPFTGSLSSSATQLLLFNQASLTRRWTEISPQKTSDHIFVRRKLSGIAAREYIHAASCSAKKSADLKSFVGLLRVMLAAPWRVQDARRRPPQEIDQRGACALSVVRSAWLSAALSGRRMEGCNNEKLFVSIFGHLCLAAEMGGRSDAPLDRCFRLRPWRVGGAPVSARKTLVK